MSDAGALCCPSSCSSLSVVVLLFSLKRSSSFCYCLGGSIVSGLICYPRHPVHAPCTCITVLVIHDLPFLKTGCENVKTNNLPSWRSLEATPFHHHHRHSTEYVRQPEGSKDDG